MFGSAHGNGFGRDHAVVIGAGMAGLLAGRVLADHFERVTILDRDALPDGPEPRKGVPQGRHLHSLAVRGSEILEDFFPGLDTELAGAGCPAVDQALDTVTEVSAGRLPRFRSGVVMRAVSRDLLEWRVRRRLMANPSIGFEQESRATGLLPDDKHRSVAGARVRTRGRDEDLVADLVVDASGRASRAPRWLEELGYEAPPETVVDARLGYATRWYRVPEDFTEDWKSLAVLPGWPENPRGGSLRRVEGDRWTAVLIGIGGVYPPTGEEAFLEFARSLPSPIIHDAIRDAEPISAVHGYRRTANHRRRYEKARLPQNFLVLGDAACHLNPSYGQGMTTAALSATALDAALKDRRPDGLARRFHRTQARATRPAWTISTTSDAQWAAGSGLKELSVARRLAHRVSGEMVRRATRNRETARTLLAVKNLLEPPRSFARPAILLPALWNSLRDSAAAKKR